MIIIQHNYIGMKELDRLFVYHPTKSTKGISKLKTHYGIQLDPSDYRYNYSKFKLELVK